MLFGNGVAFDDHDDAVPPPACRPSESRPLSGEQRLMLAVLHDAMRTCLQYRTARTHPIHGAYADARRWIESDDMGWPYSFGRICEALDLDPARVRATVLRADAAGVVTVPMELFRIARLRRGAPRRRRLPLGERRVA